MIAGVAVGLVFVLQMVQGADFADAALGAVALAVAAIPEGLPGGRHRHPGHRHQPDGQAARHREAAPLGRDARLDLGDLLGQDRHAHPQPDDGPRGRPRRRGLDGLRRGLLDRGRPARRRRRRGRRRRRAPRHARRRPVLRRRGPRHRDRPRHRRRPHRGRPRGARRQGRHRRPDRPAATGPAWARCRSTRPTSSWPPSTGRPEDPNSDVLVCVKGAPDVLLGRCLDLRRRRRRRGARSTTWPAPPARPTTTARRPGPAGARRRHPRAAGLRRARPPTAPSPTPTAGSTELTLEVLVGIVDPPRSEARDAIRLCRSAGIAREDDHRRPRHHRRRHRRRARHRGPGRHRRRPRRR